MTLTGPEKGYARFFAMAGTGAAGNGAAVSRSAQGPAASAQEPSVLAAGNVIALFESGSEDPALIGSPYLAYDKDILLYDEEKGDGLPCSVQLMPAAYCDTLKLNYLSYTLLKGKTVSLTAQRCTPEGKLSSVKPTWSSSNTAVATVSSSGKVTAKGVGKAVITAKTSDGIKATCTVTVKQGVSSMKVSPTSVTLAAGIGQVDIPITLVDKTGLAEYELMVTYDSPIKEAFISEGSSPVLHIEAGNTTVTRTYVTVLDKVSGKTAKVSVKIGLAANCVTTTAKSQTVPLILGKTSTLKATAAVKGSKTKPASTAVEWSSSDESVATVSAKGKVTAVGIGECTVTASVPESYGQEELEFTVQVVPKLKYFYLYNEAGKKVSSDTAAIGETVDISRYITDQSIVWYYGEYEDFDNYQITYSTTANSSIARLSEDGTLECIGKGSAKVKVMFTCGSQKKTVYITVKIS